MGFLENHKYFFIIKICPLRISFCHVRIKNNFSLTFSYYKRQMCSPIPVLGFIDKRSEIIFPHECRKLTLILFFEMFWYIHYYLLRIKCFPAKASAQAGSYLF